MPFRRHISELRRRLMISAGAIVVAMIAAFIFTDPIIRVISAPIDLIALERPEVLTVLNFDGVTSAFDLRLRISFAVALAVAGPVWISQIWLFIVPALTRRETRTTVWFLAVGIPLFVAGGVVGWMITPHAIALMASFVPEGASQLFQSTTYFDFILKLVIAVAIAFVLPLFLVLLNVCGMMTGRAILAGWRIAVLAAAVFAALATPAADVVSMVLLASVIIVLYFAAAAVTLILDRRRAKRTDALLTEGI